MSAVRMHAGEADIDDDLVRRLLVAQFPHWAGLPIEPVDSAGTRAASLYGLGDDMVVPTACQHPIGRNSRRWRATTNGYRS